jgi:DnaK suppressor protein
LNVNQSRPQGRAAIGDESRMKKPLKKPKKAPAAASKTKKAAPPAKKPAAKPAAKPVAKVPDKKAAPEKKPAPVAAKSSAPAPAAADKTKLKKNVAPAPAAAPKKDESKKPMPPTKVITKKDVQDKVVVATKKPDASDTKAGAKAAATAKAPAPAPIKVEPKIIEAPQPEYVKPGSQEDLFTPEELASFRDLLEIELNKILAKARRAVEEGNIQIDKNDLMDEVDQASAMVEQNLTFRLLDRDRKLLSEIEHAIAKIDSGDYGYCEGTGEPIPKRRLELRPWCRHSVKYKERLERMKKSGRGVVDEDEV